MMLNAVARPLAPLHADTARLRRVAEEFEAQALGALLQPMFDGLSTKGPFGGGSGEAQWRPMLVDAIGKSIARSGGLGIADAVMRDLIRAQEAAREPTMATQTPDGMAP